MVQFFLYREYTMPDSEMGHTFDERRSELTPYGLTCERWSPTLMRRSDRHNEIELNFLQEGALTYLIWGRRVTIRAGRLVVFWALAPHRIVHYEGDVPYYVATIPLAQFLQWKLPHAFLNRILGGAIVEEVRRGAMPWDLAMFERWLEDMKGDSAEAEAIMLLEMEARLRRLALACTSEPGRGQGGQGGQEAASLLLDAQSSSKVEQMAIFIAANYRRPVKVHEIGRAVDLNPDYANTLFRQTFGMTLSEYILEHRISHAQRMLSTTREKIVTVAYDSGFSSMSRFNAAFKTATGCTPSRYRKLHGLN